MGILQIKSAVDLNKFLQKDEITKLLTDDELLAVRFNLSISESKLLN